MFLQTYSHIQRVGTWLGSRVLALMAERGGDLIMLSMTLFGTYKISKMAIALIFPKPTLDIVTRRYIAQILNERPLQKELTDDEENLTNNVILPSMINVTFDDIGGLDNIKEEIEQLIVLPFQRPELFSNPLLSIPNGILLCGPPGTGKTMLAKAIAKQSKAVFINFRQDQIIQKYVGESEKMVNNLFSLALKLQPAVIFIDEADSIFGSRSNEHEFFVRLQCNLLGLIDGLTTSKNDQVMVLACTNRQEALDPAFLRRMQRKFSVGLPNEVERERILRLKLAQEYVEPGFSYETLAAKTEFFSGSDLEILCRTAAQYSLRDAARAGLVTNNSLRKITMDDCWLALDVTVPTTRPKAYKRQGEQQPFDYAMLAQLFGEILSASFTQ